MWENYMFNIIMNLRLRVSVSLDCIGLCSIHYIQDVSPEKRIQKTISKQADKDNCLEWHQINKHTLHYRLNLIHSYPLAYSQKINEKQTTADLQPIL